MIVRCVRLAVSVQMLGCSHMCQNGVQLVQACPHRRQSPARPPCRTSHLKVMKHPPPELTAAGLTPAAARAQAPVPARSVASQCGFTPPCATEPACPAITSRAAATSATARPVLARNARTGMGSRRAAACAAPTRCVLSAGDGTTSLQERMIEDTAWDVPASPTVYKDGQGRCRACSKGCGKCLANGKCATCEDGYRLASDGMCKECPKGCHLCDLSGCLE